MKISIDATGLSNKKTGTGVYLCEILRQWNADRAINHNFVLFCSSKASEIINQLELDCRFKIVFAPDHRALRVIWQQTVLPWVLSVNHIDVHWGTAFVLPLLCRTPCAVTIHDLTFTLFPKFHEWAKRYYFPFFIRHAIFKSMSVISVSETTKADILRLYPSCAHKISVTLLAARDYLQENSFIKAKSKKNIVALGTLEPRKNLPRLLLAWKSISLEDKLGHKLLVIGMDGWMLQTIDSLRNDIDQSVEFVGHVDDISLHSILANCRALIYPSLYEGFGLPVLEAMRLGVPVVTSNRGATLEIAGNAALLINPEDVFSIKDGLEKIIHDDDLCERLSLRGTLKSAEYSWEKTANDTLSILEEIANPSKTMPKSIFK